MRRVWIRNGKPQITNGSYADTKAQITVYLTLKVKSRDEALRWLTVPMMASDMQ